MHTPDRETSRPLADEAVALVRRWLAHAAASQGERTPSTVVQYRSRSGRSASFRTRSSQRGASSLRLAQLIDDPDGPQFAFDFVDRVIRPDDLHVAGKGLEVLAQHIPAVLPWYMRWALAVGGGFAAVIPWPIVPIARRVMHRMVGHLLV